MSRVPPKLVRMLRTPAVPAVTVALISFLVFLPAVRNGFATSWDDNTNLINNPYYRGLGWAQLKWMWTSHLMEHYVPLSWMSFGLDYILWKENPFGYHLTNVILHAVNTGLFFLLALVILRLAISGNAHRSDTQPILGAIFAALFFGLHPLRVESVAWITERRDVLSGFFYLLTLLAYLQGFGNRTNRAPDRRYYLTCFALFTASVLSKEIAVTLPIILLILDVYPLRRLGSSPREWLQPADRGVWIEKVPFFFVSLTDSAMTTYVAIRHHLPDSIDTLGWVRRLAITVYGMAFYLLKTVAPLHLSPLYPLTEHKTDPKSAPFLVSLALVLVISFAAVALRDRRPWMPAIWTAYGVTLLPVGGLIHNGNQITADRYTYLSCLGLALLAGAGVVMCLHLDLLQSPIRSVLLAGLALGVLAVFGWQTRAQVAVWRDAETIWSRVVSIEPSPVALTNQGVAFFEEGDILGSVDCYRRALAMDTSYAIAHNNLGLALLELRRFDEAIREFRVAQELKPTFASAYDGMGNALRIQGKLDEAIASYRRALQAEPSYVPAQKNLESALRSKQSQAP